MKPENDSIQVVRVDNGWVVYASRFAERNHGFLPNETLVARTPDQLSQILHEWAGKQQDLPRPL